MYKNKKICAVVPAYNEETQIGKVIDTMPEYVDKIVIIDDKSKDRTIEIINRYKKKNGKIVLIEHPKNQGVGGAIASGYKWSRDNDMDIAVVMAGDNQMDPENLTDLLDPVVDGEVDYSKGNRLFSGEAFKKIPKIRYFGNSFLSLLTKIASGYWNVADSQSGYTVINKMALHTICWDNMYKKYGQPNDILVMLNVHSFKVRDVPIRPVYRIGEKSGIRIWKVIFTISFLLFRRFLWRLKEKYIIRDFHPLIFFYAMGFLFFVLTVFFTVRLGVLWYKIGHVPETTALADMFCFMSSSLFTLFAMWFDKEENKDLK
jgi:glycosyltransferase involved in cell wall biosynthesis